MYVVMEGEVDIFIDGFHLETVSSDGIFGELSLIDLEARIASAKARTDCTLQAIDKRHFLFLVQETPMFALQVMKVMADRLHRPGPLRAGNLPLVDSGTPERAGSWPSLSFRDF